MMMAPPVKSGLILRLPRGCGDCRDQFYVVDSRQSAGRFLRKLGTRVGMTTAVVELTQDRIPEFFAMIGGCGYARS